MGKVVNFYFLALPDLGIPKSHFIPLSSPTQESYWQNGCLEYELQGKGIFSKYPHFTHISC
jgi:hypothetical protein